MQGEFPPIACRHSSGHMSSSKTFCCRDGSNLDFLTVAETAPESVLEEKDNINGVQQLSQEATHVNQAFSQQVRTHSL